MAHTVDSQTSTPANLLRAELDTLERLAVKPTAATVEALLLKLDEVQSTLEQMEESGVDLRGERMRWENVTRRLDSHPGIIARAAATAGGLAALRRKHGVTEAGSRGSWWQADMVRARRTRRVAFESVAMIAAVAAVVIGAYWLFITVFPPDPEAVALLNATTAIERHVDAGDLPAALASAEESFAANPAAAELALWVAVLAQETGDDARAEEARSLGLDLLEGNRVRYLLLMSEQQARIGNAEAALESARQALDLEPENPEATFAMGRAAMMAGDREAALEYLDKTYQLAIDTNPQLAVSARVLYGDLLRQPDFSTPSTIAEPTPGP